jgi:hypothetical protein
MSSTTIHVQGEVDLRNPSSPASVQKLKRVLKVWPAATHVRVELVSYTVAEQHSGKFYWSVGFVADITVPYGKKKAIDTILGRKYGSYDEHTLHDYLGAEMGGTPHFNTPYRTH